MLLEAIQDYRIILASSSPRRRQLLSELGIDFELAPRMQFDESYPESMEIKEVALYLAKKKSRSYQDVLLDTDIMITADTIVVSEDCILEKPADEKDAFAMIKRLSGHAHYVHTGVFLRTNNKEKGFVTTTEVWFADLDDDEIRYYVELYKPYDKAGAYGIQEWIGYVAVEKISGSYFNVMGLPVHQIYNELKHFIKQ